jgi:hypothetical protein
MRKMLGLVGLCFLVLTECYAQPTEGVRVAVHGETLVVGMLNKSPVRVKITTHEIKIGKPSNKRPEKIHSSCTYSRYPCSTVDGLEITVNNKSLYVARSVFCDLADLNIASLSVEQQKIILTLTGGDASESYIVKIVFDENQVTKRTFLSAILPDEPLQETTYYSRATED